MTNLHLAAAPLTYDRAIELAIEVVTEFGPEHVYSRVDEDDILDPDDCVYVEDNKPSCLVAQILDRHGVPIEVLRKWEGLNAGFMHRSEVLPTGKPVPTPPLVADHATASFLDMLQNYQDAGRTWGYALEMARNCIKPFPSTAPAA